MALFSFGKKKEKAPEVAAPVGKTPPTPPKIQTPPSTAAFPAIKPPQPTGLMPATPIPSGAAMTQPMAVPRTGQTGLKPSKPGAAQSTRSTQRIVLPTPPGLRPNSTTALSMANPSGKIDLPIGMILRCMPAETLASDVAELERTGAAATEIGLPMNMILGQLPSGKVEMTVQEIVPHIPPGYLQPAEALTSFLATVVSLPLMDVVMRIPPDLLALRPDQKDVDASVINMADPFTEEILREQAETARRQAGANIIEESQAPHEEFVPSQSAAAKSVAPPRRPAVEPLAPSRTAATTLAAPGIPTAKAMPPGLAPQRPLAGQPLPPAAINPALAPPSARTPTGQIPTPVRMSTPLPPRQVDKPVAANAPVPPVPRHTGPIPAPPPPRHTTSLPTVPRRTGTLSSLSQSLTGAAKAAAAAAAASGAASFIVDKVETAAAAPKPAEETPAATVTPGQPDSGKDDLQRLAALAMAQLGDTSEEPAATAATEEPPARPVPVTTFNPPPEEHESLIAPPEPALAPEPEPAAVAEAKAEPENDSFIVPPPPAPEPQPEPEQKAAPVGEEPTRAPEPEPEPVATAPVEEPVPAPEPEPEPATARVEEPIRAPESEPVALAPVEEPIRAPEPAVAERAEEPIRAPEPEPVHGVDGSSAAVAFNLNTCSVDDLVQHITGCTPALAAAVIAYREKVGSYSRLEELLAVPGMTREAYTNLTGEPPPEAKPQLSINDLLGYPPAQNLSLKDVTDRISCWPDVSGCLLSQSSGLSLVGTVPAGLDKAAVVAFAPRMFETINKSYSEITGEETDVLIIPTAGTSFHLFRSRDLYLIIMSRLPLMPERHVKVARFVLEALSNRKD